MSRAAALLVGATEYLQVDDHDIGARLEALFQLALEIAGDEQQGTHQISFFIIMA